MESLRQTMTRPVYFDFDRFDLSSDTRAVLEEKLAVLRSNPNVFIRIEGHADDRGSDEYNIALGQRRGAAAKRFFTQRGIGSVRVEVVSFGEQRPVCLSPSEVCWARNRRAEFVVTGGLMASEQR
jgi:peptidoglycan-associated lipoprotein